VSEITASFATSKGKNLFAQKIVKNFLDAWTAAVTFTGAASGSNSLVYGFNGMTATDDSFFDSHTINAFASTGFC
jgi:hypothetical protein